MLDWNPGRPLVTSQIGDGESSPTVQLINRSSLVARQGHRDQMSTDTSSDIRPDHRVSGINCGLTKYALSVKTSPRRTSGMGSTITYSSSQNEPSAHCTCYTVYTVQGSAHKYSGTVYRQCGHSVNVPLLWSHSRRPTAGKWLDTQDLAEVIWWLAFRAGRRRRCALGSRTHLTSGRGRGRWGQSGDEVTLKMRRCIAGQFVGSRPGDW